MRISYFIVVISLCAVLTLVLSSCGGGGSSSSTPNPPSQHASLTIGSVTAQFSNVAAGVYPDDLVLQVLFYNGLDDYPGGDILVENAYSIQAGVPVNAERVIIYLDSDTRFEDNPANPCEVIFTSIGFTLFAKIAGTINGELLADLDDDGTDETYALSGTFQGIYADPN